MDWRQQLARNLSAETEAYGYTLSIWGAGALLVHQFSAPNVVEVYAYVGGALLGFGTLAVLAFRCLFDRREVGEGRPLVVASMVHLVSTLGNLALSHVLVVGVLPVLPGSSVVAFAIVGFQATFAYNVFLLVEVFVARAASRVEDRALS